MSYSHIVKKPLGLLQIFGELTKEYPCKGRDQTKSIIERTCTSSTDRESP